MKNIFLITTTIISIIVLVITVSCASDARERKERTGLFPKDFRKSVKEISGTYTKGDGFNLGPGDYERELKVNKDSRHYRIHVPLSYNKSKAYPVVLVFHGGGSDPGNVQYESQMDVTSDKEGFLVVYPAGYPSKRIFKDRLLLWNDGRLQSGKKSNVDDIAFVDALLDDLEGLFEIDKKRVYACGFSNGAQFTYRLAKHRANRIAAISAVAGHRPVKDEYDPSAMKPIAVMQFSGTEDKHGPYYGGRPPGGAAYTDVVQPVKDTIKSWVEFNKCPSKPLAEKRIGNAVMKHYGPCQGDTEVVFWTLEGGGHTWPGGKVVPNVEVLGLGGMGDINKDINASDLMWEFFKSKVSKQE